MRTNQEQLSPINQQFYAIERQANLAHRQFQEYIRGGNHNHLHAMNELVTLQEMASQLVQKLHKLVQDTQPNRVLNPLPNSLEDLAFQEQKVRE